MQSSRQLVVNDSSLIVDNLLVLKRGSGGKNNRKVICTKISTFSVKWITVTIKGRPDPDELFETHSGRHNINCSKNEKCIP